MAPIEALWAFWTDWYPRKISSAHKTSTPGLVYRNVDLGHMTQNWDFESASTLTEEEALAEDEADKRERLGWADGIDEVRRKVVRHAACEENPEETRLALYSLVRKCGNMGEARQNSPLRH